MTKLQKVRQCFLEQDYAEYLWHVEPLETSFAAEKRYRNAERATKVALAAYMAELEALNEGGDGPTQEVG